MYYNISMKGFTLIELLITIGIISILSGVVLTSVSNKDEVATANTRNFNSAQAIKTFLETYALYGNLPADSLLTKFEEDAPDFPKTGDRLAATNYIHNVVKAYHLDKGGTKGCAYGGGFNFFNTINKHSVARLQGVVYLKIVMMYIVHQLLYLK